MTAIRKIDLRDLSGGEQPQEGTDLLELAWGIIANAGGGDWEKESKEWQDAAVRWRDTYFGSLTKVSKTSSQQPNVNRQPNAPMSEQPQKWEWKREWGDIICDGKLIAAGLEPTRADLIADAHNAALAEEREKVKTLLKWILQNTRDNARVQNRIAAELDAIAKVKESET
jgi:hypothetical protein